MKKLMLKLLYITMLCLGLAACNQSETTQLKQADIVDAVFASGYIIADQEYQVTANAEGYLVKSFVEEGVKVEAGMPLYQLSNEVQSQNLSSAEANYQDALRQVQVNSPEKAQLQFQIEQAQLQLELDKKNFERYQTLFESKAVSELEYEQIKLQYEYSLRNLKVQKEALADLNHALNLNLKNTKSQLVIQQESNADYFLSSSISGLVLRTYKKSGELVRRGETVAIIGGGQKIAKLLVAEEDIKQIQLNQFVLFNLNTDKDALYEGLVTKIYPSFDDLEQSFIIEARFKESTDKLYHNTQLQANIIIGQKENTWVIPAEYLIPGDSVQLSNGGVQSVQVGVRNDRWAEVLNGIGADDVIQKPKI